MIEYFKKMYNGSAKQFYNLVEEKIQENKKTFIITANPETLIHAEEKEKLKEALLKDDTTIIADGIGITKGAKILNCQIQENIPGIELCEELLKICNKYNKSIFLFGAREDVVRTLVDVIHKKYPGVNIIGYSNGYVDNKQKVFDAIIQKKPDVILVALGIPEQELLIYENLNKFEKGIFVGVGGSFDVLSGTKKRAPKFFRKLHLEWLYRITVEPKRLKRFMKYNIKFVFKLLKEKNNRRD